MFPEREGGRREKRTRGRDRKREGRRQKGKERKRTL